MWPPLHHGELVFKPNVAVHLIYLHQSLLAPPSHVSAGALQRELAKGVAGLQEVVVHEHWISFSTCDHCVTAYARWAVKGAWGICRHAICGLSTTLAAPAPAASLHPLLLPCFVGVMPSCCLPLACPPPSSAASLQPSLLNSDTTPNSHAPYPPPSALRARTGRSTDKHGMHMSVTQYLDVAELERWMGEWREALLSEAGINYEAHDPVLVLPVFIFDLPTKGETGGCGLQRGGCRVGAWTVGCWMIASRHFRSWRGPLLPLAPNSRSFCTALGQPAIFIVAVISSCSGVEGSAPTCTCTS